MTLPTQFSEPWAAGPDDPNPDEPERLTDDPGWAWALAQPCRECGHVPGQSEDCDCCFDAVSRYDHVIRPLYPFPPKD